MKLDDDAAKTGSDPGACPRGVLFAAGPGRKGFGFRSPRKTGQPGPRQARFFIPVTFPARGAFYQQIILVPLPPMKFRKPLKYVIGGMLVVIVLATSWYVMRLTGESAFSAEPWADHDSGRY